MEGSSPPSAWSGGPSGPIRRIGRRRIWNTWRNGVFGSICREKDADLSRWPNGRKTAIIPTPRRGAEWSTSLAYRWCEREICWFEEFDWSGRKLRLGCGIWCIILTGSACCRWPDRRQCEKPVKGPDKAAAWSWLKRPKWQERPYCCDRVFKFLFNF